MYNKPNKKQKAGAQMMAAKQVSVNKTATPGVAFAFVICDSAVAKTVAGSVFDFAF